MSESLIPIISRPIGDAVNAVDGRALHAKLGAGRDFTTWAKDRIARARLVERRDFVVDLHSPDPGNGFPRGKTDYVFTLDAAKHIAMIDGSDVGFEIREYFIEAEKRLRTGLVDIRAMLATPETAALVLSETLVVLGEERQKRIAAETEVAEKTAALAVAKPKADFVDEFVEADGTVGFRECVKILHRRITITEEEFATYLIRKRYAQRIGSSDRLAPATYGESQGYVTSRPRRFQHRTTLEWMVRPEFRITARGIAHFTMDLRRAA